MGRVEVRSKFPDTDWATVGRAGTSSEEGRRALATVIAHYSPALRAHIRDVHGLRSEETEDALHDFIAEKFLLKELASRADRRCGQFRAFLVTSLDRFMISRFRHQHAQRRDARLTVGLADAPKLAGHEPEPKAVVEVEWARKVVAQAVLRMEDDCEARGRQDVLAVFKARLLPSTLGESPLPYAELVRLQKLSSPTQVANLLITGKRSFTRALRTVISEYEPDEACIDEEITELRRILSTA